MTHPTQSASRGSRVIRPPAVDPMEILWWGLAIALFFVFPEYRSLGALALVMVIFVISYDLILGYAGVMTMGQGMYFGIGAYVAAFLAQAGWGEVISGALISGAAAALIGGVIAPFLMRLKGLPIIMVTISMNLILFEIANKATWLTQGDDGIGGLTFTPLLGVFEWSMFGETKYLYALGWVLVTFLCVRLIIRSGFGLSLRGIKANRTRMELMGNAILPNLVIAYVISAGIAGIAGAVMTQTTSFAGLHGVNMEITFDGIVMLVIGGTATLVGGMFGAPIYIAFKHMAQEWNPFYWMIVVGVFLILIMRFSKGGFYGLATAALRRVFLRRSASSDHSA